MRTLTIALVALVMVLAPAWAQDEETLFGGEIYSSGFGGPEIKLSTFNDETALLVGGRGAWLINHVFALGGGGYGVATNHEIDTLQIDMGYGGGVLEYIFGWDNLVHGTVSLLVGAGGINIHRDRDRFDFDFDDEFDSDADAFFVMEPGINAELNVTKNLRFTLGVSYRWVTGVNDNEYGIRNADVSGPSGNLMIKFGSF